MHDSLSQLDARVERVLAQRIRPAVALPIADVAVSWWPIPDEDQIPGRGEPVSHSEAIAANYEPIVLPEKWGPAWGTTWFRLDVDVPDNAFPLELHIDLGWADHSPGFQAEALVLDGAGRILKGLHPRSTWVPVPAVSGRFTCYLEAASNPLLLDVPPFLPVADGDRHTACAEPIYTFRSARLVAINEQVRDLAAELELLSGLAARLPADSSRRWRLAMAMQDAINVLDTERVGATAPAARERLRPVLELRADADAMKVTAVGHAHIDSAWLWPIRETRRKVARTLANVVNLLDAGYRLHFALPAAQHVAWLEQSYPELLARVREWTDRGAIVPVGGMWVEPDAVLPTGEAMCRQLLYGQRYFERVLGRRCKGVWLPDSFGYSGALPQIARLAGADWFLTQKLSWNRNDTFPHNSFLWEGIDGTRIFTHFPAADTYNSDLAAADLDHAEKAFKEKGKANSTLVPFGYGDGGGGPTREMIRRAELMGDLCGAPHVIDASPDDFFTGAAAELRSPEVWVGELYLELHRGTLTSQCATKRGNRRNETLLREAETWWSAAAAAGLGDYPHDEIEKLWQSVLLGQFHDILPGTSIAWVHDENRVEHERVSAALIRLADEARALLATGNDDVLFNGSPVPVCGVPALGAGVPDPAAQIDVTADQHGWRIASDHLEAYFDISGRLRHLIDTATRRDVVPEGACGGVLHLIPDFPTAWDAWDIEKFQRTQQRLVDTFVVSSAGAELRCSAVFGSSSVMLTWGMSRDGRALTVQVDVDWHEHDLLAKLALPLDVHTTEAAFETQFGHIRRPIHQNTSWDAERFEVSVHRWLHLGEPGFGVAIANEASYGCDILRTEREGGGTYAVVRPSLVRGPRFPDPETDQGRHRFGFAIRPGTDLVGAMELGYRVNHAPVLAKGCALTPLVRAEGLVIEAVKMAEDRSGDLVVRLYEPTGTRTAARILGPVDRGAGRVDLLEDELPGAGIQLVAPGEWTLDVRPFEIVTIRLAA